jgi:hypothetical protein
MPRHSTAAEHSPATTEHAAGDPVPREQIAAEFRYFASSRAGTYAPLYARLAAAIADDPVALDLAGLAQAGQSRPDLLLAVIHDRLMADPALAAARFYPSITDTPDPGDPAPSVLRLVHEHQHQLASSIAHRLVQTNEPGRCAFLAPALQEITRQIQAPLALFEVGASAGLNLLMDRYSYRYHRPDQVGPTIGAAGPPNGQPTIDCDLRGNQTPPVAEPLSLMWRSGIDLDPLDVDDAEDRRWLRALVWPDHRARAARLDAAISVARAEPDRARVHRLDATGGWEPLVRTAPAPAHLVIFHSAVAAHMPDAIRTAFTRAVLGCSTDRPLSWVQAEPRPDGDPRRLRLVRCAGGRIVEDRPLGSYQPHGSWLRWSGGEPDEQR